MSKEQDLFANREIILQISFSSTGSKLFRTVIACTVSDTLSSGMEFAKSVSLSRSLRILTITDYKITKKCEVCKGISIIHRNYYILLVLLLLRKHEIMQASVDRYCVSIAG